MDLFLEEYLSKQKLYSNVPSDVQKARKSFSTTENRADKLYVYYDVDTIDTIANETKELWFKSADSFVDIEEYIAWGNKFFYVMLDLKNKEYSKEFKKIVEKAFKSYDIDQYLKRYYILCLSYEPDNNVCWNTFSSNKLKNVSKIVVDGNYSITTKEMEHLELTGCFNCSITKPKTTGGCICFNHSGLDCSIKSITSYYGFINYDFEMLASKFFDALDVVNKEYIENKEELKEEIAIKSIYDLIDICNLFYKNKFYLAEKEYRYVIDIKDYPRKDWNIEILQNGNSIIRCPFSEAAIDHITITNSNDESKFSNFEIRLSKISFNEEKAIKNHIYEI